MQVTHFNYPATTGMTAMGWRISDPLSEPDDGIADRYSVELLYRMPRCAWCYDPGEDVPDVAPLPALRKNRITFASLNKPLKHSARAAALWAEILKAVPGSKLLLLGLPDKRENCHLHPLYVSAGIDPARLIFAPPCPGGTTCASAVKPTSLWTLSHTMAG